MKNILAAVLLSAVSTAAFADTYFVRETATVALSSEDTAATTELVRADVEEGGHHQVVTDEKVARYVLQPKLIKLGNAYIMTLEKSENGKPRFSSQLKSRSIDELDTIVSRLTRSVITESLVTTDARVDDLTQNESVSDTLRREAVKHWYFGFGPTGTTHLDEDGTQLGWSLAYVWDLQTHASINFFISGAGSFLSSGLGLRYCFSDRDISPLVEADFGYGGANDRANGFVGGAGVGYDFFRTSSVNVEMLLHYDSLIEPDHESNPAIYGLRLGLYF